jgi:hypothetical protein
MPVDGSEASVVPVVSRGNGKGKPPTGGKYKPTKPQQPPPQEEPGIRFLKPGEFPELDAKPEALPGEPWPSNDPPEKLPRETPAEPPPEPPPEIPPEPPPEIPQEPISDKLRNIFIKAAVKWIARALILALAPELVPYLLALQVGIWAAKYAWPFIRAYFQEPKTLEELQRDALTKEEGYDVHHFVEKKQAEKEGVPKSVWDGPENRVRIPTLKHWQITGWYMTKNKEFGGLSPRQYLVGKSWAEKVEVGRKALIKFGVLLP